MKRGIKKNKQNAVKLKQEETKKKRSTKSTNTFIKSDQMLHHNIWLHGKDFCVFSMKAKKNYTFLNETILSLAHILNLLQLALESFGAHTYLSTIFIIFFFSLCFLVSLRISYKCTELAYFFFFLIYFYFLHSLVSHNFIVLTML